MVKSYDREGNSGPFVWPKTALETSIVSRLFDLRGNELQLEIPDHEESTNMGLLATIYCEDKPDVVVGLLKDLRLKPVLLRMATLSIGDDVVEFDLIGRSERIIPGDSVICRDPANGHELPIQITIGSKAPKLILNKQPYVPPDVLQKVYVRHY